MIIETSKSRGSSATQLNVSTTTTTKKNKKGLNLPKSVRVNDHFGGGGVNSLLNKDVYCDQNSETAKMIRLMKQSQRTNRLSLGKNRQEEIRLKMFNNLLEKNYLNEDNKWFKEFIETKRSLNDIKFNTTKYAELSTSTSTSSSSGYSSSSSSSASSNTNSNKSCKSQLTNSNSLLTSKSASTCDTAISNESNCLSKSRLDSSDINNTNKNPYKDKQITKLNNSARIKSSASSNKSSIHKLNTKMNASDVDCLDELNDEYGNDDDDEYDEDYEFCLAKINPLKQQSNGRASGSLLSSIHTNTNFKYGLLPCVNLKSYTSMIDSRYDKSKDDLDSILNNSATISNGLCSRTDLASCKSYASISTRIPSRSKSSTTVNKNDDQQDDENDITTTLADDLIKNKSIRRPQIKSGSSKELIFRLKSLQSKVKFCREQNSINLKADDRNIRYGDPLPRKQIYRQLRIISQFETVVK